MFHLNHLHKFGKGRVLKYFDKANVIESFSYENLCTDSSKVSAILNGILNGFLETIIEQKNGVHYNVAVILPIHSPALLPAFIGITNANGSSCFILATNNLGTIFEYMRKLESNLILCELQDIETYKNEQFTSRYDVKLFGRDCVLLQMKRLTFRPQSIPSEAETSSCESTNILFFAFTSGTCGVSKMIGVTYKCFIPNILSFGELYGMSDKDVIFVSSPQTFDPFMIDVCLAIKYGCCLVMTHNDIRCSENILLDTIFPIDQTELQITIMQTTPSLFMRWSKTMIRTRILSKQSQLKILALGGEAFPSVDTVAGWSDWNGKCRIFNLYGLSEMSCWSSFYEITSSDILNRKTIPIGNPIDQHTHFEVDSNTNELTIKSKIRKCFQPGLSDDQVYDSTFEFLLHTGDKVRIENDSEIFFDSRLNSIIKIFGQKIDLNAIELLAKSVKSVEEAVCLHDAITQTFILFVKWDNAEPFNEAYEQLGKAISCATVRITIQLVEGFPLTAHGKIDKKSLLNDLKSCKKVKFKNSPLIYVFARIVGDTLGCSINPCLESIDECKIRKRSKAINESSFKSLGGSSLKAIQIIEQIKRETSCTIPDLLPMLLDEECNISDIMASILRTDEKSELLKEDDTTNVSKLKCRWNIDMKKCVDATPTVCMLRDKRAIVSVGSHSKMLYNVLIANGEILSQIELPNRIESQVTQVDELHGIVGCYDGCLYCFEFVSGNIKWKFHSGGMIKCQALLIDSIVVFGNYNSEHNLWFVDVSKGQHIWSCRIGLKSIYANPVNLAGGHFLVSTLDGQVAKVSVSTKSILWTFSINSPIFASPVVVTTGKDEIAIFIAAVTGIIYQLNESGNSVSSYRIDGNIFTTFEIIPTSNEEYSITKFVFGSQNHFLYLISYNHETGRYEELWKRNLNAPIRSVPLQFEAKHQHYILCFTTTGTLNVIDSLTGKNIRKWSTGGGIFSSPSIWQHHLFIGSRNNLLHCVTLEDLLT